MSISKDIYRAEVSAIPRLPKVQQPALIDRARSGDNEAKQQLIISLLAPVYAHCHNYTRHNPGDDMLLMELASVGNYALVNCFDRLIGRDYPLARMLATAYGEIRDHWLHHYRSLISLPHGPEVTFFKFCDVIEAFDVVEETPDSSQFQNIDLLYQALDMLPENPRSLIIRSFGLLDHAPETVKDLAQSEGGKYGNVRARRLYALKMLKRIILSSYPALEQKCSQAKPKPAYAEIVLPMWCRKRLDEAREQLEKRGETLSMNKLRQAARVHTRYASAYLYQLQKGA